MYLSTDKHYLKILFFVAGILYRNSLPTKGIVLKNSEGTLTSDKSIGFKIFYTFR